MTDLQWSADRTYFITASRDKTAKLVSARDLEVFKTYPTDTALNSAVITPNKDYVILGGGQSADMVTTTNARSGKFEARFYHKIFEDEIGRVRGHFGPLVRFPTFVFLLLLQQQAEPCPLLTEDGDNPSLEHGRRRSHWQGLRQRRRRRLCPGTPV